MLPQPVPWRVTPRWQSQNVHATLSEAEWITLMFFLGLFILVHGVVKVGLIDMAAKELLELTGGDFRITALIILWSSAVLSAFIDNIPFVATMIPLIKAMAPTFGGDAALLPRWWAPLGLAGRQPDADRRVCEPGGRRPLRTRGNPVPVQSLPEARVSLDAAQHRISHFYLDSRHL